MTPLTRTVLVTLLGMYVLQLLANNWAAVGMVELFGWWTLDSGGFRIWQPFTSFLIQGPGPLATLIEWVVLFFFIPPVEGMFGKKQLGWAMLTTVGVAIVLGMMLVLSGAVTATTPAFGLGPLITSLIVLFGLSRPNSQILLFFVLPIKAGWIAWGSGLLALLFFLATRSLDSAVWLTGWVGGYAWLNAQLPGGWKRPFLKMKQRRIQKKLERFEVIEGGIDDDEIVH